MLLNLVLLETNTPFVRNGLVESTNFSLHADLCTRPEALKIRTERPLEKKIEDTYSIACEIGPRIMRLTQRFSHTHTIFSFTLTLSLLSFLRSLLTSTHITPTFDIYLPSPLLSLLGVCVLQMKEMGIIICRIAFSTWDPLIQHKVSKMQTHAHT